MAVFNLLKNERVRAVYSPVWMEWRGSVRGDLRAGVSYSLQTGATKGSVFRRPLYLRPGGVFRFSFVGGGDRFVHPFAGVGGKTGVGSFSYRP